MVVRVAVSVGVLSSGKTGIASSDPVNDLFDATGLLVVSSRFVSLVGCLVYQCLCGAARVGVCG